MNKPVITYYKNGKKYSEEYFLNGEYHRTNGPANISWYPNGQKRFEEYYLNDELHRADGPAILRFTPNGVIFWREYWINGEQEVNCNSDEEFKKIVKLLAFK